MFAFVRFLLLAMIVLAVVLFMQPNLLKELGLQLPDEETGLTTETGTAPQPDEAVEATEPAQEESTPPSTVDDSQLSGETPAAQEPVEETALAAEPEATANNADQAPAIGEEVAPAGELSVEEPGQPPLEPVPDVEMRQEMPEVTAPVTDAITGESPDSVGEEVKSEQPASVPAGEEQPAAPAETDEELPLLPEMPPPYAEGTELPVAPVTAEEPATPLPVETLKEEGFQMDNTQESPFPVPGDEQPPAGETAPQESTGEADEIPTAGSPELQRVLEDIDRTFNNQQ